MSVFISQGVLIDSTVTAGSLLPGHMRDPCSVVGDDVPNPAEAQAREQMTGDHNVRERTSQRRHTQVHSPLSKTL